MIDTNSETLISIPDVPAHVPTRPHIATVWRWIQRGVRGVKLETVLVGGRRLTSVESIARFIERSNAPTRKNQQARTAARKQAIEAAERELSKS